MATDDQAQDERGVSLVGTLVVLVILGGLAALVLSAWPDDPSGTSATLRSLTSEANLAGGGAPNVAAGASRSPVGGAGAAACTATVRSIEQAAATMHASGGAFPSSISELVTSRWLSEAPATPGYALTMAEVGGQRNGKVLVNGLPSERGCAVPPRMVP